MTGNKKYYKLRSGDPTTWKLEIFYTDIENGPKKSNSN